MPLQPASGEPVLFETYRPTTAVNASAARLSRQFALPLDRRRCCCSASCRSRSRGRWPGACGRARCSASGCCARRSAASDAERRRIAGSLHDGVVQDLAGVSYSLSATAGDQPATAGRRRCAMRASQVRNCIRRLRSALVDIYPPDLQRVGLEGSLQDLAAALREQGVETSLDVGGGHRRRPGHRGRGVPGRPGGAAQRRQACAGDPRRRAGADERTESVVLEVRDDGRGFVAGDGSEDVRRGGRRAGRAARGRPSRPRHAARPRRGRRRHAVAATARRAPARRMRLEVPA